MNNDEMRPDRGWRSLADVLDGMRSDRNMHLPTGKPACWTNGPVTPRAAWAHDHGMSCGNAADPATWAVNLHHTPGCDGCARARRALQIAAGMVVPVPSIKTVMP
jgi:hypothetical protein